MLIFVIIVATILRFLAIHQSFWLDEAITAQTAAKQFPYQWTGITGDFQPPFYYLILHAWMKLGVRSEWFLRIPSILFGLATIWLVHRWMSELYGKKTAFIAASLFAVSQFHIYYSQELRMYSLLGLLSAAWMYSLFKNKWLFFTVSGIIGIYTNYMFLFLIPAHIFILILQKDRRKYLKNYFLSLLVIILFFIPWMTQFGKQLETGRLLTSNLPEWKSLSSLPVGKLIPQIFLKFAWGRVNFSNRAVYALLFIFLASVYFPIVVNFRKWIIKDRKTVFIFSWFIIPLVFSVLFSFIFPVANVWRLIIIFPAFIILTSISVGKFSHTWLYFSLVMVINLTGDILYYSNPIYQRENWRQAVEYIEQKDFPVVFTADNGFAPYEWYNRSKSRIICSLKDIDRCLNFKNVIYVDYLKDLFDKEGKIKQKLVKSSFLEKEVTDFQGVGFIYLYENSL